MNLSKNRNVRPDAAAAERECLQGTVRKVIFSNEENGFAVLSVTDDASGAEETVVGTLAMLTPGESIKFFGRRATSVKFGPQFQCDYHEVIYPGTEKGLINFLSSGFIHGVGVTYAERIVQKFGMETIEILSKEPGRLREVRGIGEKRIREIRDSWEKHRAIRDVMMFLQSYDISAAYATRIYRVYQHRSVEKIRENPYCLATDVPGIGFIMADRIAAKMGVPKDSPRRAEAGVVYLLTKVMENGHTFYPLEALSREASRDLDIPPAVLSASVDRLAAVDWIRIMDVSTGEKGVYLSSLYAAETTVAADLRRIRGGKSFFRDREIEGIAREIEEMNRIHFSEGQFEALKEALVERLLIITGGPGTGKTTLVKSIVQAYTRYGGKVLLAAPTGRAAKRMAQASEHEAKTIHRLLEFNPMTGAFGRSKAAPLECDLVIIDETSMVDILLLHHLLQAVGPLTSLIFVGDADQLPSVGPGNVLRDMIFSGRIPVVALKHVFRQKKGSEITLNAHNINQGKMIEEVGGRPEERHFFFIRKRQPEEIRSAIEELILQRIPRKFGYRGHGDIQVITPMHRGAVGVEQLNECLQRILNPHEGGLQRRQSVFKPGDKVMQIVNNYDKDVFNGDIGFIESIDREAGIVTVDYDGRKIAYSLLELDELVLAYAISVHKSQGSEYKCVIMPVTHQHYIMLQRNLLYTAVTRGKELVVLVGDEDALRTAIKNDRMSRRYTDLQGRIVSVFDERPGSGYNKNDGT